METEELFKECKRRYPIGTRVNSLGGTMNHKIEDNTRPYLDNHDVYIRFDANCVVYDFRTNQWAQIVSPVESIINNTYDIY